MGKTPAAIIPSNRMDNNAQVIGGGPSGNTAASTGVSGPSSSTRATVDLRSRLRRSRQNGVNVDSVEDEEVDVDVVDVVVDEVDVDEVDEDDDEEEAAVAYLDAEVEDVNMLLSGSDGAGSDVDNSHHRQHRQRPSPPIGVLNAPNSRDPSVTGSGDSTLPQASAVDAAPMEVDDECETDGPQNISDYILNVVSHNAFILVNSPPAETIIVNFINHVSASYSPSLWSGCMLSSLI